MSIKAPIRHTVSTLWGRPASLLMLAVLPLTGCGSNAQQATNQADQADDVLITEPVTLQADITPEAAQWLPRLAFLPDAGMLVTDEMKGLFLVSEQGATLAHLPGGFGAVDHRSDEQGLLVALVDEDHQQALLARFNGEDLSWETHHLPQPDFKIDGLCLHRDSGDNDFLFVVGEEGLGEQWLVAENGRLVAHPGKVRNLSLPPQSEYCQVDDVHERLYVNEENVGLWAYQAHPEAGLSREPVSVKAPFGDITGAAAAMAVLPGSALLVLDPKEARLHRYPYRLADNQLSWEAGTALPLASLDEPERLDVRRQGDALALLIRDDAGLSRATLAWQPDSVDAPEVLPRLRASVQTDPVPSLGDAADDPAIWVHPERTGDSRVLGTDKQGGLGSYDLSGKQVQYLPVGRMNNVDVRTGFALGDRTVDLAVASNRDRNSLQIFAIDRDSGELTNLGDIATPMTEIYGLCMAKQGEAFYAIPNDKDGTFIQYRLSAPHGEMQAEEVRRFNVDSQPEGCVADDAAGRLFVGEENAAVWTLPLDPAEDTALTEVIAVDGDLVDADIEGLAVWRRGDRAYLVISSQGNNAYVITDATPPYAVRGAFRIGLNARLGIDGASETDGLEASAADLGGAYADGLLVVQDGRKRMPEGNQNYKLLPFADVIEALDL